MRSTSVIRFSLYGAVGFGVGGAIDISLMLVPIPLPVSVLVGGAVGGASLGLALRYRRKAVMLSLLGALGLVVGVFVTLSVGSYFNYSSVAMGAVIGASLGVAFLDWRVILVLAVAGAVGFGVGLLAGDLLRALFPVIRGLGSITVAGLIGGASLGAALGFLQTRNPIEERRPRVR